jgi:hypothetical protein
MMNRVDEGRIWARVHLIWEREGRPDGQSARHRKMALAEIAAEDDRKRAGTPIEMRADNHRRPMGENRHAWTV